VPITGDRAVASSLTYCDACQKLFTRNSNLLKLELHGAPDYVVVVVKSAVSRVVFSGGKPGNFPPHWI